MLVHAGGGTASTGGRALGGTVASSLCVTSEQDTKQISDTDNEENIYKLCKVSPMWRDNVVILELILTFVQQLYTIKLETAQNNIKHCLSWIFALIFHYFIRSLNLR